MRNGHGEYPIQDYAIIGNCETAALVNSDGGIDWLCLPAFDSPSFFGALVDRDKGGSFSIQPTVPYELSQHYEDDSAILRTRFITEAGPVELVDFFVIARQKKARFYDFTSLYPVRKLVRLVRSRATEPIAMQMHLLAGPDYARKKTHWKQGARGEYVCGQTRFYTDMDIRLENDVLSGRFDLQGGGQCYAVLDYSDEKNFQPPDDEELDKWLRITRAFWREWNLFNYYKGSYQDEVRRSAVTLKLLTYAPTGAFVAAPTTSLPESPGRDQNWDYRYAWVRDTSLFITSLFRLGYSGEARAFFNFIRRRCKEEFKRAEAAGKNSPILKVLYGIREDSSTREIFLDHLQGYRNSRPVRIGNRAEDQFQIDIYGHLFDAMRGYLHSGGKMDSEMQEMMDGFISEVFEHWRESDNGIWELTGKKQYTYGKVMAWLALKHACSFSCFAGREIEQEAEKIHDQVMTRGTGRHNDGIYLAEAYGTDTVDASCLLAFPLGFLPREYAENTRRKIEADLGAGPLLFRNPAKRNQKGEGAFLLCSFWLINHLLREGKAEEAEIYLREIIARASPLGLYAEEIDVDSGDFLGNFPQAFTHLGLINSILNLEQARKTPGFHALTDFEKFEYSVGATIGWKGVVSGFFRVPQTFRLLFSRASKWPE